MLALIGRRGIRLPPTQMLELELIQHPAACARFFTLILGITPELVNCRRLLCVVRSQPAAGGQTELPNGCGRLALRAYEEKSWRAAAHCCCPRRMAGDLVSSGRGQLDDHDRDHALQRLAAVSPLAAGERFPLT
jgi:hypothetical protein